MNPEKAIAYTLAGEAAVLAGPEIVKSAVGDWGSGQELAHTQVGQGVENVVDAAQGMAPILGVLFLVWKGVEMTTGGSQKNKSKSK